MTKYLTTDYSYSALPGASAAALNALANDAAVLSDAIDNSILKYDMIKISINLASVDLSAIDDPHIELRLIEALDNPPTIFSDNSPQSYGITVPLEVGTGAQAHLAVGDMDVPHDFKIEVVNRTGQAFAALDTNVITYTLYTPEDDS